MSGREFVLIIGAPWLAFSALALVSLWLQYRREGRESAQRMHPSSPVRQARTFPTIDDAGRWLPADDEAVARLVRGER